MSKYPSIIFPENWYIFHKMEKAQYDAGSCIEEGASDVCIQVPGAHWLYIW